VSGVRERSRDKLAHLSGLTKAIRVRRSDISLELPQLAEKVGSERGEREGGRKRKSCERKRENRVSGCTVREGRLSCS